MTTFTAHVYDAEGTGGTFLPYHQYATGAGTGFSRSPQRAIARAQSEARRNLEASWAARGIAGGCQVFYTCQLFKNGVLIHDKD